jgi:hypothetical protein
LLGKRLFNWLFRPIRAASPPSEGNHSPANLDGRLLEIEAQLRDLALVRIEWTEVLDKLQAWTNRQNARDAKRLKAGIEKLSESHEDAPEPTNGGGALPDTAHLKIALRKRLQAQRS